MNRGMRRILICLLLSSSACSGGGSPAGNGTGDTPATGGTTATEFHVDKKSAWPKGKYTVEVMLNGASAGTKDLEVK